MSDNQGHPGRHSTRLHSFDYTSEGAYFLTFCTFNRVAIFGTITNGHMALSKAGQVVQTEWLLTLMIRREVILDAFQIMPNHVHAVIFMQSAQGSLDVPPAQEVGVGAHGRAPLRLHRAPRSVGALVAGFKASTTKRIHEMGIHAGIPVWQRNYHDRIVRDDAELNRIRQYVIDNPANWPEDEYNRRNEGQP